MVSRSELEKYSSINDFANHYLHHPHTIFLPSAECQYIEGQIREHLGIEPLEIYKNGVPEGGVGETLGEECQSDIWRAHNLSAIFQSLVIHRQMRDGVGQIDGDQTIRDAFPKPSDLTALMDEHYNLGFLTARLISEYFVRYEIEPLAEKGLAQVEAQQRRNIASGQKSTQKRHQSVEAMLAAMERLCDENPAIGRFGIKGLADLAVQDAVKLDRNLWKQGSGQRDEYLDEMRADLRYQKRFHRLSLKTA